jgi:hypothetical protein
MAQIAQTYMIRFSSRLSVIHDARYYEFGKTGVTQVLAMPR